MVSRNVDLFMNFPLLPEQHVQHFPCQIHLTSPNFPQPPHLQMNFAAVSSVTGNSFRLSPTKTFVKGQHAKV